MEDNRVTFKYINFDLFETKGKTNIYICHNNKNQGLLGRVKWFFEWKQYCFFPDNHIVISSSCLHDIKDFVETVNIAHKQKIKMEKENK